MRNTAAMKEQIPERLHLIDLKAKRAHKEEMHLMLRNILNLCFCSRRLGLEPVSLLKIVVEGHEPEWLLAIGKEIVEDDGSSDETASRVWEITKLETMLERDLPLWKET